MACLRLSKLDEISDQKNEIIPPFAVVSSPRMYLYTSFLYFLSRDTAVRSYHALFSQRLLLHPVSYPFLLIHYQLNYHYVHPTSASTIALPLFPSPGGTKTVSRSGAPSRSTKRAGAMGAAGQPRLTPAAGPVRSVTHYTKT